MNGARRGQIDLRSRRSHYGGMSPLRYLCLAAVCAAATSVFAAEPAPTGAPASTWYSASRIDDATWRIVDHDVVNVYLVLGRDRALLIDTGYGQANLRDYVAQLTTLPLLVVNTHGHGDHCGGDVQFGAVSVHPADVAAIKANAEPAARARQRTAAEAVPATERFDGAQARPLVLTALRDGEKIDLGGRELEVITAPGHTPGEIVLLESARGLLFAGDHLNRLVWLQLPGCLPLENYLASLEKVAARGAEFSTILPGHHGPIDAGLLAEMIAVVRGVLAGTISDVPYSYGGTTGRIAVQGRASLVFAPGNLRAAAR